MCLFTQLDRIHSSVAVLGARDDDEEFDDDLADITRRTGAVLSFCGWVQRICSARRDSSEAEVRRSAVTREFGENQVRREEQTRSQ